MKLLTHNFKEKVVYGLSMALSQWLNWDKNIKKIAFKNILVFKLDEIGDLCYSLHVFDLLKQRYPGVKVTLVCKPYGISLVNSHPSIDKIFTSVNELKEHYDLIIDLRGNFETIKYALIHKPVVRLDRGTVRYRNKKGGAHPHEVITNTQIIAPLFNTVPVGFEPRLIASADATERINNYLIENNLQRFIVLHSGARRILRRWPASNFVELAVWVKQSFQLDCIFTGDAGDLELNLQIQQQIPFKTYNTAGIFKLNEFVALVKKAVLYVGNESGPLCIATVAGTPSLGLFGPGEPFVFYPYGKNTSYLHHVLECNPCDQIHCVHPENPCIQRISLNEVKLKITEMLTDAVKK
ncbi:MAG: glycosyltransferase family 9 protein [Bacteroidia bacterium]|nr:glycosyltransferase family 9 protein [Bacteroidia bacterium]